MINKDKISRYIAGDSSQDEKEEIQLWLEAHAENRKEFMSLRRLYDITIGHLPEQESCQSLPIRKSYGIWMDVLKIAAAIVLTFGCSYYFLKHASQKEAEETIAMQTLHVPAGQRAELTLTDGSKVCLNAQTTFTFPSRFTNSSREVFLDGEGYFEVMHDEKKRFSVHTTQHTVHVLGTEFNVSSYSKSGNFETSLLKGSVEITTKDNAQSILLTPNSRAYWENNKLISAPIVHYDHFLWTKGIISFDDERIEDIFNQLQLYYDIKVVNMNKKIGNIRYTGKFRTKDGIEHVLNVLQIPTGLRYAKDNEKNLIIIK